MLAGISRLTAVVRELLCSLRLTVFLLISIAIVSIVGTLLPQGSLPASYLEQISPLRLQIYSWLGLFNMYHSWWFSGLLFIFSLNLIFCSIRRLPHVISFITAPALLLDESHRNSLSLKQVFHSDLSRSALSRKLTEALSVAFSVPVATGKDAELHLFAQKYQWSRLGVYVVHLSVLLILSGAIIGAQFGFSGNLSLVEGRSASVLETGSGKSVALGFELRCESFSVEFYPDGAPKEYKSVLTVLENGQPVEGYKDVRVIVNEPLKYRGIKFYQSTYGNTGRYYFTVVTPADGRETAVVVDEEAGTRLPDGSLLRVLETTADISRFAPGLAGAAAVVELVSSNGDAQRFASYAKHPGLNRQRVQGQMNAPVIHYKGEQMFTGLKVVRDPGVWWVWSGCFLMMIGLVTAFFLSHKRVWIIVRNGQATMYGNSSKHQVAFEMEFAALADRIGSCLQEKD